MFGPDECVQNAGVFARSQSRLPGSRPPVPEPRRAPARNPLPRTSSRKACSSVCGGLRPRVALPSCVGDFNTMTDDGSKRGDRVVSSRPSRWTSVR